MFGICFVASTSVILPSYNKVVVVTNDIYDHDYMICALDRYQGKVLMEYVK